MTPFTWWFSLLLIALQQPRDLEPGVQVGSSELAGLVVSMDAAIPLRGAIVTATVGGVSRATITDEAGRFLFREFPAGRVLVSARKPGYVTMFFGAKQPGQPGVLVVVGPNEQASGVRITLPRGAVITGTIRDSHGAPARHTPVATLRVGSSPTGGPALPPTVVSDDRGMYRLFDLAPGDYVVVALPPYSLAPGGVGVRPAAEIDAILRRLQQRSRGAGPAQPALRPVELSQTFAYVPIYYPGSAVAAEADRIRVGAGEERHGVDFTVRLVRTATITGAVTHPSGTVPDVTLSITPEEPHGRAQVFLVGGFGPTLAVRPGPDGRFEYTNVPPGRYTITARTPRNFDIFCGMAEVTITNEDVSGVGLALQPGLRVIGRVVLDREPGVAGELDLTWTQVSVRRSGLSYNSASNGTMMGTTSSGASLVGPDGTFEVTGLLPGDYQITVSTTAPGAWRLQSATIGARDVLDGFAIDASHVADVLLTMSNRHTVFEGKFHAPAGSVAADYFLVVFPGDRALWSAGSRRIEFTRPSTNGDFVLRDLPAGQYRVAAMTDVDPDQLTNRAFLEQALAFSIPFGLIDGQTLRQDLKGGR